jgi:hypothetical protein
MVDLSIAMLNYQRVVNGMVYFLLGLTSWLVVTGTHGNFRTFHSVGNKNPNWLICFRGVETTNQLGLPHYYPLLAHS